MMSVDLEEDRSGQLRALLIAMIVIPTAIVSVRCWSRALLPVNPTPLSGKESRFGLDDYFVLAALVSLSTFLSHCNASH